MKFFNPTNSDADVIQFSTPYIERVSTDSDLWLYEEDCRPLGMNRVQRNIYTTNKRCRHTSK